MISGGRWLAATTLAATVSVAPLQATDLRNVLTDYTLTSFSQRDGLPPGPVWALAQDGAGYLWIGSEGGLLRFDGVRFTSWSDQIAPGSSGRPVRAIVIARDQSIWAGFGDQRGGVVHITGQDVVPYGATDGLSEATVLGLAEDATGTIWLATEKGLFSYANERWTADPSHRDTAVYSVFAARNGDVFIGTATHVSRRSAGEPTFKAIEALDDIVTALPGAATTGVPRSFAENTAGLVIVNDWHAGFRVAGQPQSSFRSGENGRGYRLMFDRRQNLWVGTIGQGVWRMRPHADSFLTDRATSLTGMLSDGIYSLLEDRDGNIWAGTTEGLNRLVPRRIKQITDYGVVVGVEIAPDGRVWVGTENELLEFPPGAAEAPRARIALGNVRLRAILADERGAVWAATDSQIARLAPHSTTFTPILRGNQAEEVELMTSDRRGGIWVSGKNGLARLNGGRLEPFVFPYDLQGAVIEALFVDSRQHLWIGLNDGRVVFVDERGTLRVSGPERGLAIGSCRSIFEGRDGTIWLSGLEGLARYRYARDEFRTLRAHHEFPVSNITTVTEDDVDNLWLGTGVGILRITKANFEAVSMGTLASLPYSLYNRTDGLAGMPHAYNKNRRVVRASDGRFWFVTSRGLSVVDPDLMREQRAPGPITIDYATADEKRFAITPRLRLPPGTSRLGITYSELNLESPLRTQFRYRLDGFDADWIDAGSSRQAAYTNLPPQRYRFRVAATGPDGGWVEPETAWEFSIAPTLSQTPAFRVAVMVAVGCIIVALWQLRLRQVRQHYSLIIGERVRLSRELHDTLLQNLVGMALQFDVVAREAEELSSPVHRRFVRMRKQVEQYIRETRQAIWDLRSPRLERRDLVAALKDVAEHATQDKQLVCSFKVEGTPRRCKPRVEGTMLRVVQEALNNVIKHAEAKHVDVIVRYQHTGLIVEVIDDGRGFDIDARPDLADHYGILSMHERVEEVRGRFELSSQPGSGTCVRAIITTSPVMPPLAY